MVDFNNETTVTRPPAEIVKVLILEHRENLIEAFEFYHKKDGSGVQMDTTAIHSRLFSLFLEIEAAVKRRDPELHKRIVKLISSRKYPDLEEAFFLLNELFDKMKLTLIDGSVPLGGNIIERNKAHGVPL